MITVQQIVLAGWAVFLLYWFMSAGSAKPIRETRGWLAGNWYPILLLIGFLFMVNSKFLGRLGLPVPWLATLLVDPSMPVDAAVVVLVAAGLIVAIVARRTLAGNWSGAVAIKEDHELVTTGLYSHVRHPIYTGILCMTFGTALSFGSMSACIGFLAVAAAMVLKLSAEEKILAVHFSEEYPSYTRRTKALLPFVW